MFKPQQMENDGISEICQAGIQFGGAAFTAMSPHIASMGAKREMNALENNPKFNTEKLDSALTEKDEFLATPEAETYTTLSTQRAANINMKMLSKQKKQRSKTNARYEGA